MVLLIAGLGVARCAQARHGEAADLAAGAAHLRSALAGDATQWEPAEAAFSRAAHGAIFNAYPVFALEMTRRIRTGDWGAIEPALRPAAQALAAGDFGGARRALDAAPGAAGYPWLSTLLRALEEAGQSPR